MLETLLARLNLARDAYYNGDPIMPDAEYDALEDQLRALDPNHPYLAKVGAPVKNDGWVKVRHSIPMGSQNKAQTPDEMLTWSRAVKGPLLVTDKLDGLSIALRYQDRQFVQALTRGDGETGEDVTVNVRLMQGIPRMLPAYILGKPTPTEVFIRGEILIEKATHIAHFPGEANPRNSASGTAKRLNKNEKCQYLQVRAYQLLGPDCPTKAAELAALRDMGFLVPTVNGPYATLDEVLALYDRYNKGARAALPYEIDGLVVEANDTLERTALGDLNNRPRGSVAFKFPHEAKPSTLLEIRWQVGNSGRVTPVAMFDPVALAGASVSQATLHNISYIEALTSGQGFHQGDKILVSRRNEVIPAVEELLIQNPSGAPLATPVACPACGGALSMDGEYLRCTSSECSAQVNGALIRWVNKIGVLHFGEALIQALSDAYPFCLTDKRFEEIFEFAPHQIHQQSPEQIEGLSQIPMRIPDLYHVDPDKASALELSGRRAGGSAVKALANLKAKVVPFATLIGSLGIPLVGRETAALIVDAGYPDLPSMLRASKTEIAELPGIGEARADSFAEGIRANYGLIAELLGLVKLPDAPKGEGLKLSGQSFCLTGFRDPALTDALEAAGATIKSGVSKGLTYLIMADPNSSSTKAVKARTYGTKVISIAEAQALASD